MKPNTRKRFIRVFMSSVLTSDMTEKELMEFINEFPYDPELILEIKQGLSTILKVLHTTQTNENEFSYTLFNDQLESAYATIQKRRLPKEFILEMIRSVVGSKEVKEYSVNNTVRELLAKFYSMTTQREQALFSELLDYGKSKDDAFLQGIIRKR